MTVELVKGVFLEVHPADDGWIVHAEYAALTKRFFVSRRTGRIVQPPFRGKYVPPGDFQVMKRAIVEWRNRRMAQERQAHAYARGDPLD